MKQVVAIDRPLRWDHPLDPGMAERDIAWLTSLDSLAELANEDFGGGITLADILKNDARINRYESGDVIIREGEYGSSAFIVLRGQVRVLLAKLEGLHSEAKHDQRKSWLKALRESWKSWPGWETRRIATSKSDPSPTDSVQSTYAQSTFSQSTAHGQPMAQERRSGPRTAVRTVDDRPRIFLQDVTAVLNGEDSESLGTGELFGEMAAITRSPSNYTVVAEGPATLLEIRWQGLRLLRNNTTFRNQLDRRYRESGLKTHLRETPLFQNVPAPQLELIANATKLRSFGDMEWFSEYIDTKSLDSQKKILQEPTICEENTPVNSVVLIRSGFARLSHKYGHGHRTEAYLGRGQTYGLSELMHNIHSPGNPLPYQSTLRAIGFLDALIIPCQAIVEHAIPYASTKSLPATPIHPRYHFQNQIPSYSESNAKLLSTDLEPALLEFLVDQRLINGRQTMVIDTECCTRCDDCVQACAATHEGNPRFIRTGPQFGQYQFTQSCMHCTDPVCMIGCPTGAISRVQSSGVIAINPDTCIGCQVCANSCPYDNIIMVPLRDERGRKLVDNSNRLPILQATKCDLCQTQPSGPACQNACPHDALVRINVSDLAELKRWMNRNAA